MNISQIAAALGRRGGKVTSEAKADSARKNGASGGRPRHFENAVVAAAYARKAGRTIVGKLPNGKRIRITAKGLIEFL